MGNYKWQDEFFQQFATHERTDFLLVACPGAGKTKAALRSAADLLARRVVRRVQVIAPTVDLKRQWAANAEAFGFKLDHEWKGTGLERSDFRGAAMTYAALGKPKMTDMCEGLALQYPTLAILDEIHHLRTPRTDEVEADGQWAIGAKRAVEKARRRLGLSGTPYRTDSVRIPFVEYDPVPDRPGEFDSRNDYFYGYQRALKDEICRRITFRFFPGMAEWWLEGEKFCVDIQDQLKLDSLDSLRHRTWLNPQLEALGAMFTEAHKRLMECRIKHPDAGGLILATERRHAERCVELMYRISGYRPVLIVSEDDSLENEIGKVDHFRESYEPWVVAVKKVSEGIDIPRLRVLAYATTCKTRLFYEQAIGRVVRAITKLSFRDQEAYVFHPAHPQLVEYARYFEDAKKAVSIEEGEPKHRDPRGPGSDDPKSIYVPVSAEAVESFAIQSGQTITAEALQEADGLKVQLGLPDFMPVEEIAKIVTASRSDSGTNSIPKFVSLPQETQTELMKRKGKIADKLAVRIDYKKQLPLGSTNKSYYDRTGLVHGRMSETQLDQKIAELQRILANE